ncbi:MAG: 3'-5' exonuclease [Bacteroidetes bacterium GWF2_33_38]|nr:MAG: 3'-5' exonuclease [Bacteroidetes bacterium GWF2_33_38]OFY73117.1 MAG: 3'-5' exonuclease [Bacteroidetes bacterium RIFOXYA12_FULL_33_9]OFY88467.1 MAG: 3'-5' exonuclease [Bacteroidetes bacterium RIFOXYA2_FULL_33_7]HBX51488.1 3'-5' exonuclease [Bacteroidales bacterium]
MLSTIKIDNILFLDIETVPACKSFDEVPEALQKLWDKKSSHFREADQVAKDVYQRAGIYAEFGKIICISVGIINSKNATKLRLKSFYNEDEKVLLNDFINMLNKFYTRDDQFLCAHNGKEFDFPYISRRLLINGLQLPKILDLAGKKPWENRHLDTLELWKFGDYKNYTSLELLATIFNIPTPKDDIDGSMVCDIYWQNKELERIVRYCEKDVVAIVQLFRRYRGEELILDSDIEIVG